MRHLAAALARADVDIREATIADYCELRPKLDPRGHDLLAALEQHHLGVLEQLFKAARATTAYMEAASEARPRLRVAK